MTLTGKGQPSETAAQAREQALHAWASECLQEVWGVDPGKAPLEVVSGDASFRRYFRLRVQPEARSGANVKGMASSYILVDAPPQHEDCQRFVLVADALRHAGVKAPIVHDVDYLSGFMLLQDFGDTLYLPCLLQSQADNDLARAEVLYRQAMDTLVTLQKNAVPTEFPPYDRHQLHTEMKLFDDWYCQGLLGLKLQPSEQSLLDSTFAWLEDAALSQPVVCVHRDYHSRNLMVCDGEEDSAPGVVDFQDAVAGAYTYDLVSLLRDCYVVWPLPQVQKWALQYLHDSKAAGIVPADLDEQQFFRDFDLMGLQRHIKVVGIFCRLHLRDGKTKFLHDIPLVIEYLLSVARRYPEMEEFVQWFSSLQAQTRAALDREISA